MNSETREVIERCAKDAGAIVPCPVCRQQDILGDEENHRKAYAMAMSAWKAGDRAFRDMHEASEVSAAVKSILDETPDECSRCAIRDQE